MQRTSFGKDKIKVVLLEGIHPNAVEAFRNDGYSRVERLEKALPEPMLVEAIRDAHIVGIRSRTHLSAQVLAQAERLVAVGAFCIGTNQIDLDAARERGVPVFNAPFSNTRSVAELVVAEVVLLMRGIPERNAAAHRGGWLKSVGDSHEVRGKTLGIVGYGHIGTQVGVLAEAMGMRVVFHDVEARLALGNATPVDSLDALLDRADVVTLHVPDTPQTRNLIGAAQLARMKQGARLLNASRGTVVDVEALAEALGSAHLAGAAVDVFPSEPEGNDQEFTSPLRRFDNVLLTPHVGGSTQEAQQSIGLEVSAKLIRYSNNGSSVSAVNFPEVSLPEHPGKHRFLHIHRNQPGVLHGVNEALAEARLNVASQYLQTDPTIGYVVIDVDADEQTPSAEVRKRLEAVPGTIRTRVLY